MSYKRLPYKAVKGADRFDHCIRGHASYGNGGTQQTFF